MPTWPDQPAHGEFVVLPLSLPPQLLEAVGYDGEARYVALWHCGDDILVGDGASSGIGRRRRGFEVFYHHRLIAALLRPYQLLAPDHDPYLDPPHSLLADRWENTLAVGQAGDVDAFVHSQPSALEALTEGLDPEEITRLVREAMTRRPPIDMADILAAMAAADRLGDELCAWLDRSLAELRGEHPAP
ncbi:MAG: hypothetical protein QOD63_2837 [Actinomycetota bacterium]|jgi:hypothetical protein|nr:hypothetical protein [Actinomycetota bacterium]